MVRVLLGASILLLVSVFFAYVLTPIVDWGRRRVRLGRRRRPASRAAVIIGLYMLAGGISWAAWDPVFVPAALWARTSAPGAVDRLFDDHRNGPIDRAIDRLSGIAPGGHLAATASRRAIQYLEHEIRTTLRDVLEASRYGVWLLISPLVAFLLLTGAPAFRRSAQRLLPHGHLQWRVGEYLRDVNSALAGYVRAQLAAGMIVGVACLLGFWALGLRLGTLMGVAAGALELVPAVGPAATLVMASSQAGEQALAVVAFLALLRVVQDYVIYPRLIRNGMHLPTAIVILSIWGGAVIGGAAGVFLAIPVAGFVSVSLRHWREYRAIERLVRAAAKQRAAAATISLGSSNER